MAAHRIADQCSFEGFDCLGERGRAVGLRLTKWWGTALYAKDAAVSNVAQFPDIAWPMVAN